MLVVAVFVGLAAMWYIFGTVVPVGSIGVRKIAFGPGQGITRAGLQPGYHWTIPGYSTIYLLPQTVHAVDFDREAVEKEGGPANRGPLDVPTVDGTSVDIDASVFTTFYDGNGTDPEFGQHGGPADLIANVGADQLQWSRYIAQVAETEFKRALSGLSTVDFYNPKAREDRVREAEASMRKRLAPVGVRVEAALVRRYTYRQEIDQAIFKKNLQELEVSFNKVAGEFAEVRRDVNKVQSDGDVEINNLNQKGLSDAEKMRAEGDLYRRERMAESNQKVAEARAEVDKLRSTLLAQVGGDTYVALQMAQVLSSLKGGVVRNIDPFNFDVWVERLTGKAVGATGEPAAPVQKQKEETND